MANALSTTPSFGQLNSCRYLGTPATKVALSVTTAKTVALTAGVLYRMVSDVDWHIKQGPQGTVTATADGILIRAKDIIFVLVTEAAVDDGVAGILDASTGSLYYAPAV